MAHGTHNSGSDPSVAEGCVSEAQLAQAAWSLIADGRLAGVSKAEAELLRSAGASPASIHAAEMRAAIRSGADPLGDAFLSIRSAQQRRSLGATYTPPVIIDSMVAWIADNASPGRIIDPGAGSGRFVMAAARAFPKASLVAVEVDPLAALMARANLTAQGLDSRSTVVVGDFRDAALGDFEGQSAYLGNPPYVRHHQIERRWKEWLSSTAAGWGLSASQLAGLHVHFFLAALCHAAPGDVGSFVTSAEWLDVNYGALLRQLLCADLGGLSVHVIDPRAMPFEGTATTGSITCFGIGTDASSIKMKRVERAEDLARLQKGRRFAKKRLRYAKRWTPLLTTAPKLPEGCIELGELCRVHRGAVTGANATWITRPEDPALPDQVLFPSVTKARELFGAGEALASADGLRAVIDLPADLGLLSDEDLALVERFLKKAKRSGAHAGYVARHRKAWWSVGLRAPAPILATYMARRAPAFVRNASSVRHINVAHGIYPRQPLGSTALDKLAAALRETASTAQGRTYAGGLTKFEPKEMERLPIPDLPALTTTA